jgi:5-methylcytosine-specific restriction protein A
VTANCGRGPDDKPDGGLNEIELGEQLLVEDSGVRRALLKELERRAAAEHRALAGKGLGAPRKRGPKPDPNRAPRRQDRRWQEEIRAPQLAREPHCRRCTTDGKQTPAVEVNHIVALADAGSFDDPINLESLCRWHHMQETENQNAARQGRKPRRIRIRGCDVDGNPLDPLHPWNRE